MCIARQERVFFEKAFTARRADVTPFSQKELHLFPAEGYNNKIKVLKRNAYGYRNFENFRKRILLNCAKDGNQAVA